MRGEGGMRTGGKSRNRRVEVREKARERQE